MAENNNFRRQIAVKLRINDLTGGQYIKEEGLRPNYVMLKDNRKISRVNIIGTVVSVGTDSGYQSFYMDDGTGKLSIRSFEQNAALDGLELGNLIFVIGRPRAYGQEIYVLPEIIKPIINTKWIEVRTLELKKLQPVVEEDMPAPAPKAEEVIDDYIDASAQKLLDAIKKLDTGAGADYENVISESKIENAEKALLNLMKNGEVFEVSPGKLKVLE